MPGQAEPSPPHRGDAWAWWRSMGEPKKVLAPMVGASERAFRLLSLECGAQLCVTPMIHARMFGSCPKVRADVLRDVEASAELGDRPLLAQLCGDDAETLLNCARAIAPHVDGVDLNLGCPQGIAKRGSLLRAADQCFKIASRGRRGRIAAPPRGATWIFRGRTKIDGPPTIGRESSLDGVGPRS